MAVEESASAAPDKCLQPPNCGGDQIPPPNQMTPSGAPIFRPKTPAMSQQQSNLMSPTSNLVIQPAIQRSEPMPLLEQMQQQFIKATDLPQISAPLLGHSQIQMKPYGAPVLPAKTPAMSQQQSNLMSPTSNLVIQPAIQRSEPMPLLEQMQLQFIKATDLPQISAPQLGHSQIQMKLPGAPLFPPKTPAMSPQQSNLMSSTSNLVMLPRILRSEPLSPLDMIDLQFVMAMKQSTSAAPAKSLKPPNCSGHQISPPNPQIPNLSSPIVSPSSTSMDLLPISAPQLRFGDQQQFGIAMDAQGAIKQRMCGGQMSFGGQQQRLLGSPIGPPWMVDPAGQLSMLYSSQPAGSAAHANTQLSSPQPYHISFDLQQQFSQLTRQQAQLETVQQRQAAQLLQQQQQLQQLLQQPSTPAFGKNMTPEITSSNKDSGQLLGQRKIQDLVSQVRKALEFQLMESDAAANRLEAILQLLDPLIKSEQLSPPPAAGSHVLQKISQLWLLLSAAFSPCFPAELLSTKNQ